MSIDKNEFYNYVSNLLKFYFPDKKIDNQINVPKNLFTLAIDRLEYCFSKIKNPYYRKNKDVFFNHLNSDHMVAFLYFFGNTIWKELKTEEIPTKLFYLNKIMHGIDLFYSVKMPDIFMVVHPLGTIIGKADYKNYLVVYQNCTIGSSGGNYPIFDEKIILFSNSVILGKSKISKNVIVSANSFLINSIVPERTVVFGQEPSLTIKTNTQNLIDNYFN